MEAEFRRLDVDEKGYLTKQEFLIGFRGIGGINDSQLELLFTQIDTDRDGRINEEEFVRFQKKNFNNNYYSFSANEEVRIDEESDEEVLEPARGDPYNKKASSLENVDLDSMPTVSNYPIIFQPSRPRHPPQQFNQLGYPQYASQHSTPHPKHLSRNSTQQPQYLSQNSTPSHLQYLLAQNSQYLSQQPTAQPLSPDPPPSQPLTWTEFCNEHIDLYLLSQKSQEQLCELYQQLYETGLADHLSRFEDVVVAIIKDVRQQQCENERLERSYKREKEQHSRHLRQLEEEMETQVQKIENRVKKELKEKHDNEKEDLKNLLETEILELQENLKRLQQIDLPVKYEKPSDEFRVRLDEVTHENRSLKRQLNDSHTNVALMRSEIANSNALLDEKTYDLETEKQTLMEYLKEHENLTRQIHQLHDANKKLHDTNDDLRGALESTRMSYKRPHSRLRMRKSSIVSLTGRNSMLRSVSAGSRSEYIRKYLQDTAAENQDVNSGPQCGHDGDDASRGMTGEIMASLADELSMAERGCNSRRLLPAQDSCEVDSIAEPEDIDSGRFTMRDVHDDYSDDDLTLHPTRRNKQIMLNSAYSASESQMMESFEESVDCQMMDDCSSGIMMPTRSCSVCSRSSSRLSRQSSECTAQNGHHGNKRSYNNNNNNQHQHHSTSQQQQQMQMQMQKPVTQDPERIFKIVLAGDAAVGKSSFIMRLCKNKFVTNLNSTLGVDFQTKTLEVDGRVIALQLWDTAGQERFRSIAKSYFRRADGVLLLYDVTYERSFINVRDWLEAIEEGAQKQIPIMLVGNKSDQRAEQLASGDTNKTVVKPEDGQRLAREFRGLFIETSAKEGNNVMEAVVELSRMLMTNEDLEVQTIGLKLQDTAVEGGKKKSPCCNI